DHVVLDGNHPLAGIALRLSIVVRDVREATDEEIEAGSVGPSGLGMLSVAPTGQQLH
ncbi:MAG TPA: peptidylprolyl isomerase, partial [Caldimonas sp.]|nr:peptidylprolyl isomerase [Caldimonas sp.]